MDSLDGLRGVAVLIVFLSHTSNEGVFLFPFIDFSGIGKSCVFLFFVLSSFLLTLPFIKRGKESNLFFISNYAIRRFFRIYPLFIFYLMLGFLTSSTLWQNMEFKSIIGIPFLLTFQELLEHLLLVQGKGVTWSILVEFRYYFLLPLLALTYSVILKNHLLLSTLLTVILIASSQIIWPEAHSQVNDQRLGPYLPIFFLGSLLALIFHKWQVSTLKNNKNIAIVLNLLGWLAMIALILMTPSFSSFILKREIPYDYYHNNFLLFGILWSIVLFSCMAGGGLRRLFESASLRYLGFISFSIYLFHVVIISLVNSSHIYPAMKGWVMLTLTIVVSHITWLVIEKPTSKIKLDSFLTFSIRR